MSVVILLAATVAMTIAVGGGTGLGALSRWQSPSSQVRARTPPALIAAVALGPALLALLAFAVLVVPNPYSGCHCAVHGGHHPHVCIYHPLLALPLLAPALVLASSWTAMTAWRLAPIVREVVRGERWARRLRSLPVEKIDGISVRVVDRLAFGAFTVGVLKPVVAVDRNLWSRLAANERRALVHHENAHVERHDPLTLAVLRIVAAMTLWPSNDPWIRAWRSASETLCDRHAALTLGDPTTVAQALVSVERLRTTVLAPGAAAPMLGIAGEGDLEVRVLALLDTDDTARAAPLANDLLATGVALIGLMTLAFAWPGNTFHHWVESLLGLLV